MKKGKTICEHNGVEMGKCKWVGGAKFCCCNGNLCDPFTEDPPPTCPTCPECTTVEPPQCDGGMKAVFSVTVLAAGLFAGVFATFY